MDDVSQTTKDRPLTAFERRVLRCLGQGTNISGNGMVAYVAAARRLEKRGLLIEIVRNPRWILTAAGRQALEPPNPFGDPDAPHPWDEETP